MVCYRARWILPITGRPIRDGWVQVGRGRIVAVGDAASVAGAPTGARVIDLGEAAILPGLVNAHTHLELSHLRGQVRPARNSIDWIRDLMARRAVESGDEQGALADAIDEVWRSGTALVGDISNTLATVEPLRQSPVSAVVFHEIIGFNLVDPTEVARQPVEAADSQGPAHVRESLAAHAPYSAAPAVFAAIKAACDEAEMPYSVHLGESLEELEFLQQGSGPWRQLLEELGKWNERWVPPQCGPAQYLDELGWFSDRAIVAHGVHLIDDELALLARRGVTLVTCPRSNLWTGAGTPPVRRFYSSGVSVAVGTDSLASTPDLNLFSELATLRRLAPAVPAAALLESATLRGAEALGFAEDLGAIAAGRRAVLIAVRLRESVEDVEEYLVSGIEPDEVQWLDHENADGRT